MPAKWMIAIFCMQRCGLFEIHRDMLKYIDTYNVYYCMASFICPS